MPAFRALLALALFLAAGPPARADDVTAWSEPAPRAVVSITFRTAAAPVRVRALVADTEEARVRGLAGRALGPGEGLLYDFGEQKPVRMWTRDDSVPLDMAFLGEEGVVSFMRRDLRPGDATPVPSGVPVRYVLELQAGTLAASGIAAGDAVEIEAARDVRSDPGQTPAAALPPEAAAPETSKEPISAPGDVEPVAR